VPYFKDLEHYSYCNINCWLGENSQFIPQGREIYKWDVQVKYCVYLELKKKNKTKQNKKNPANFKCDGWDANVPFGFLQNVPAPLYIS